MESKELEVRSATSDPAGALKIRQKIASDNALGLYRECGGVEQPGNKTKPIADAFPIQAIELSRQDSLWGLVSGVLDLLRGVRGFRAGGAANNRICGE